MQNTTNGSLTEFKMRQDIIAQVRTLPVGSLLKLHKALNEITYKANLERYEKVSS